MINTKKLAQFLVEAKKATYASAGEGGEIEKADGSKELGYSNGSFSYNDNYVGFMNFIGQEIVRNVKKKSIPVWAMNYHGRVIDHPDEEINPSEIYIFLKKALSKVEEDKPFRGPDSFIDKRLELPIWYENKVDGDIKSFVGVEGIFLGTEKIYELEYHGGLIL